jgi:Domain of unknown function (DUF4390)
MPACAKTDRVGAWRLGVVVAGVLSLATSSALGAGFVVSAIQARAVAAALHVNGSLDLSLTPKVEEAIGKGIPIQLVVDLRLYRQRPLIWDERVESWTLRRELSYHALSGQYLIGGVSTVPADRESFTALNEALTELGSLDDVTLSMEAPLAASAAYRLEARVRLDIEALPPLLRPVAYTSSDWDLNSEWTAWKVQH